MEFGLILTVILLLVAAYFGWHIYNEINPLWHKLDEAKANIEVVMHKRTQLTKRLVEVASQYVGHEKLIHLTISADRAKLAQVGTQVLGPTGQTAAFFSNLAATFPDLKADQTFRHLMADLTVLETEVQNRYEGYNNSAKDYNAKRTSLPTYLYASFLGFNQASYLDPSLWYSARPK